MHGTFDREDEKNDSFLITEQDYVDYLGRAQNCVPPYLATRMAKSNFLFLGYSLTDWNVRVMLRKLRQLEKSRDEPIPSWAINKDHNPVERKIWEKHDVNIYEFDLKAFACELAQALGLDPNELAN